MRAFVTKVQTDRRWGGAVPAGGWGAKDPKGGGVDPGVDRSGRGRGGGAGGMRAVVGACGRVRDGWGVVAPGVLAHWAVWHDIVVTRDGAERRAVRQGAGEALGN
jgi:hypothetical protein